jgi:hypothetical protein
VPRHPNAAVNNQQTVSDQDDTLSFRHNEKFTKEARGELPKEPFYLSEDGVYVPPRNERRSRISTFLAGFSVSKFPYRYPRLHALFLELRSFRHRIQLVWQQGGARLMQTGPVYQPQSHQTYLELNRQTQLRTQGIQHLFSGCPWLSGEDGHLFLMGWNMGWESRDGLDNAEKRADTQFPLRLQEKARQSYAAPSSSAIDQT